MISTLLMALQAAASPTGSAPVRCQAAEIGTAERAPAQEERILYVGCGQAAIRVGKVEEYRSSYNAGLQTLAVVVRERGRTRVLLARAASDGAIDIEDVSGDIAKRARRPFNVGLRALDIDLGRFSADGSIEASDRGQPAARLTPGDYAPPAAMSGRALSETRR